jgi:hypothetical protein
MGAEGSKDGGILHAGGNSVHDAIDVATFEAERQRMREISRMDHAVRSRFNHGIRYNMKVIMRGSKGTGKSLLWRRFQGMPFSDDVSSALPTCMRKFTSHVSTWVVQHEPTPEIQVTLNLRYEFNVFVTDVGLFIQIATINWTSPTASVEDEAVKVEVWDVVDGAFRTLQNSVNRISTADLVYNLNDEGEAQ